MDFFGRFVKNFWIFLGQKIPKKIHISYIVKIEKKIQKNSRKKSKRKFKIKSGFLNFFLNGP